MICMHATLRGGLVTMAVSGPAMYLVPWACQGLIYWGGGGGGGGVEAYIYLCFVIRFW